MQAIPFTPHILETVLQSSLSNPNPLIFPQTLFFFLSFFFDNPILFLFPLQASDYKHRFLSLSLSMLCVVSISSLPLQSQSLSVCISLSLSSLSNISIRLLSHHVKATANQRQTYNAKKSKLSNPERDNWLQIALCNENKVIQHANRIQLLLSHFMVGH